MQAVEAEGKEYVEQDMPAAGDSIGRARRILKGTKMQTRRELLTRGAAIALTGTGAVACVPPKPTPDTLEYGQIWAHPDSERRIIRFSPDSRALATVFEVFAPGFHTGYELYTCTDVSTMLADGWKFIGTIWDR